MSAWPTLREWFQFGGTLALELAVIFAVAKLVSLRLHSASWRRALWQMSLLAMLLVVTGELNGVRGWLRRPEKKSSPLVEKKVVVTLQDGEPDLAWFRDSLMSETSPLVTTPKPTPRPSHWQQPAVWPVMMWATVAGLVFFRLLIAQILAGLMRWSASRSKVGPLALRAVFGTRLAARGFPPFPRTDDAGLPDRAQRIARTLGIRRKVVLLINARAVTPFTFGVWRPVIVLPANFSETFTPEQQDAALAHELAHVAGFDSAWRWFSQFTCAVLWWHPLVWLAKRELDHASELVADEASLLLADGPDRLAECLVACAKELRRPALTTWLGMDGGGFRSALGQRVSRLLQLSPHARLSRPVPWYLRLLVPTVCAVLLWLVMAAVLKPVEPHGGAWRSSILGSALAAPAEARNEAAILEQREKMLRDVKERNAIQDEQRRTDAARLVQNGKVYYETGQLHAARTNLQTALQLQPDNQGAHYYLDLVNAREQAVREKLRELKVPMDTPANQVPDASSTNLQTRFFNVDPNTLEQGLKSISTQSGGGRGRNSERKPLFNPSDTNSVIERVQRLLQTAGVDLSAPGRALIYQDRVGVVMVRATPAELDTVGKAIQLLNMTPQQLTIRVRVFEMAKTNAAQGFDWFLGTVLTNPPPRNRADSNAAVPTITGILTDWQFREVVRALEQRGGSDLLNVPEITTLSGRQAQIKVVDIRYIVTGLDRGTNAVLKTNASSQAGVTIGGADAGGVGPLLVPIAEPFELGPVIDVVPYVMADGYTIQMTVLPTLKEFLGYDQQKDVWATGGPYATPGPGPGSVGPSVVPLPKFRLRQVATTAMVWDGQTLMIGAGSARTMQRDRDANGVITTNYTEKELIYFITPRLIDAAGNVLHPDDELPERHKTVPGQPADSLINEGRRNVVKP